MMTCPCGWTIISPQGDADVTKHISLHLQEFHPDTKMTEEDLLRLIKTV